MNPIRIVKINDFVEVKQTGEIGFVIGCGYVGDVQNSKTFGLKVQFDTKTEIIEQHKLKHYEIRINV